MTVGVFGLFLVLLSNASPAQSGVFLDATATRLPDEPNAAIRADVGDVDADGDIDVIVASGPFFALRHEALPDQAARDRHEEGWKGCFESLESHVQTA